MRLVRRLPKRGFHNIFKKHFEIVNIENLKDWDKDTVVEPESLEANGLIRKKDLKVKVLGTGNLENALTVKAHAFSASAKEKIESAGGTVEVIG